MLHILHSPDEPVKTFSDLGLAEKYALDLLAADPKRVSIEIVDDDFNVVKVVTGDE